MTKQEVFEKLVEVLCETFEFTPERIKPESRLYEELDIDSIDAVDLLVELNLELGVTLIVVTHARELAQRMARVLELKEGRLVQSG